MEGVQVLGVSVGQQAPLELIDRAHAFALPTTERLGLQVVHLDRPVPRHVHLTEEHTQTVHLRAGHRSPEVRVLGVTALHPRPALRTPVVAPLVALVVHELEPLGVGHLELAHLEGTHSRSLLTVVHIPAVAGQIAWLAQRDITATHEHHTILGRLSERRRRCWPAFGRSHVFQIELTQQHTAGVQVNVSVLNPHEDGPRLGLIPREWRRPLEPFDDAHHQIVDLAAVVPHLGNWRPIKVIIDHVIPIHLIDTNGKHLFKLGVDALCLT
mmetsp:Transcript_42147/g.106341  ORF Transcript_42147/g.106341 Transcript_42147/m.106341 type:complete len:269 (-) Transcript_42147:358-1164(-)